MAFWSPNTGGVHVCCAIAKHQGDAKCVCLFSSSDFSSAPLQTNLELDKGCKQVHLRYFHHISSVAFLYFAYGLILHPLQILKHSVLKIILGRYEESLGKSTDFKVKNVFESHLYYLSAWWPQATYLTSQNVRFFINWRKPVPIPMASRSSGLINSMPGAMSKPWCIHTR